jgi:hypothetical protein
MVTFATDDDKGSFAHIPYPLLSLPQSKLLLHSLLRSPHPHQGTTPRSEGRWYGGGSGDEAPDFEMKKTARLVVDWVVVEDGDYFVRNCKMERNRGWA